MDGVGTCACQRWKEQGNGEGGDEEVGDGGRGEVYEEAGVGRGGGEGGGLAAGLLLHGPLSLPPDCPQQVAD